MSRRVIFFWALFAVTLAVYAVMIVWSLPTISAAAGGATPFDLRPSGYSFAEAQAFLSALSPVGVAFYLDVQQRLDLFYPALLAATLFLAIAMLTPVRLGGWRWALAGVALFGGVFDYLENHAVAALLKAGAQGITPDMVATADRWTRLKSVSTTVAMMILLILLLVWGVTRWRAYSAARA